MYCLHGDPQYIYGEITYALHIIRGKMKENKINSYVVRQCALPWSHMQNLSL